MSQDTHVRSRRTRRPFFSRLSVRILVILGALALSFWSLLRTYDETGSIVRLGLDLQGGMHLVLEVDDPDGTLSPEARADAAERSWRVIRSRVDELGVSEPLVQVVGSDRIMVELAGITDEARAREMVGRTAMLEWRMLRPAQGVRDALPRMDRAIAQASDTLPPLSSLLLDPPGQDGEFAVAEEDLTRARALLTLPGVTEALPRGSALSWGWEPWPDGTGRLHRSLFVVEPAPFLSGDALEDARADRDPETGRPVVHFELSRPGGRIFAERTGRHVNERMAILLDEEVVSAPVIQTRIGSRGVIQLGDAPMAEAHDMALVLRAGALPAPLRIVEERTVGPSLGQDSIDQGRVAGIVGIVLVLGLMVLYYGRLGVVAAVALGIYSVLLLGALAGLDRVLTLPGIAGLILSVGMAVDANVLIFERMREETDAGRSARGAVEAGFAHALSAIVDANVTTLVTALVLLQFGTGPVRGFAVTLSLGILLSFFTALYVTRTLILLVPGVVATRGLEPPSTKETEQAA